MRKFIIPSNCSYNVIHFNFNLMLFALVYRAPSGNSIIYAVVNTAIIMYYQGRLWCGIKSRIWYNILQYFAN